MRWPKIRLAQHRTAPLRGFHHVDLSAAIPAGWDRI